jgi:tetratricopeptide (TPR) repeat protein
MMLTVILEETQVILIGASSFPKDDKLCPLPSVKNNIEDLALLFQDTQLIGVPKPNITIILDEAHASTVGTTLYEKAKLAVDTLIVYYAGHGLIGSTGNAATKLFLAVGLTTYDNLKFSALSIEDVKSAIEESPAKKKILIVDSCFSGRALPKMSDDLSYLNSQIDIKGTCTITSVARNELADAPEGEKYTAFSGALINLIEYGIGNEKPYINLEDLYQNLRAQLSESGYLEPQRSLVQDADQINLFRNRAFETKIKPNSIFICDDGLSINHDLVNEIKDFVRSNISEEWHVIDRKDICFAKIPTQSISEQIIKKSDIIIGIVGNFYGAKYSNNDTSCLEYELRQSRELSRSALIFYISENLESESDINELTSHCKSPHDRTRTLSESMKKQEKIKAYLNNNTSLFKILEIDNLDQITDHLSGWIKEFLESKKTFNDSSMPVIIEPSNKNGLFVPNYSHLEYDRRPVNYLIQDLDIDMIDFFLEQPEAVTQLREATLLRSDRFRKLSYLGIFHDKYPSLGAFLCFSPKELLSNQYDSCKLHMVAYAGLDRGSSRPTKQQIISDNLLNLYDTAMGFLEQNLNRTGKIGTNERDDLEIPRLALREAIANAIVHRNYEDSDFCKQSNKIVIYTDRIEIISYGSLPRGVSVSDLNDDPEKGTTFRCNPIIAEIFRIMQRVELNASGISRIHLACRRANLPTPFIEEINSASVKITLFRPNDQIIQTVTGDRNQVIGQVVEDVFGGQTLQINDSSILPHFKLEDKLEKYTPNNIPRSGSITFIGRTQKLQELHAQLQHNDHLAITAISGMGGIGKTELALQYAITQLKQSHYPAGLCWLRARDQEIATQIVTFAQAHLDLTPPDQLEIDAQVRYCWQQWPEGEALIILDDVTDYKAIEPYLPPSDPRFKILITTRLKLGSSVEEFSIEELDEESAITFLESLAGYNQIQTQLEEAKALCKWVGYLPLALELLGRFLARKPDWTINRLLKALDGKRLEANALIAPESGMTAKLGVAAALELSWQELNEGEQELACVLGMFAIAPIPWSLVAQCLSEIDSDELEETRDFLISRSLLTRIGESSYQLHQIVQEFCRIKLEERSDQGQGIKSNFCRVMVAIARSIDDTPTIDEIGQINSVIVHLEEVANQWIDSLANEDLIWPYIGVGRFYGGQGNYGFAEPWYRECLEITLKLLGQEHPYVASSLNDLAGLYEKQGKYEKAEPLYIKALQMREKLLGQEHPDVASSLNNLALLYVNQERYEEAEPLYKQAIQMLQKLFGHEYPSVALSLNNLAGVYVNQERYEEAEPLYKQAIQMLQKLFGHEYPSVALSLGNLALLYANQERYEEAESLYLKSLEMSRKLLGQEHPDIAQSLNNLGLLYAKQQRYEKAEALYIEALNIYKRQLGEEHPSVAQSLNNLAALFSDLGKYKESESLYLEALNTYERLFGGKHPSVAMCQWSLGVLFQKQGRYDEGKSFYLKALKIAKAEFGYNHPHTQGILGSLNSLPQPKVKIFFSYAHEDEALRDELAKHLKLLERQGMIRAWHDRNITAGEEWKTAINANLESAGIILLLISADFLASDYCYDIEMKRALERHGNKEARVIPIILRSVDWHRSPFGKLVALPTDGKPITSWSNQDEAFTDVVKGLRKVIDRLQDKPTDLPPVIKEPSMNPNPAENPSGMTQTNTGKSTGFQINVSGGTVNISPPTQQPD